MLACFFQAWVRVFLGRWVVLVLRHRRATISMYLSPAVASLTTMAASGASTTSEWKKALDVIQGEGLMMPRPKKDS